MYERRRVFTALIDNCGKEKLFSVNEINEEIMVTYQLKRKSFTKWDETDNLKKMKDSDILAENKKKTTDFGSIGGSAVTGAVVGSGAGAIAGGVARAGGSVLKGAKIGAGKGALVGAGVAAAAQYLKGRKQAKDNKFYNDRLAYAKRQAARRERKDWKGNMTNRDGYSY